jgi:putative tricarboxylic transport membrane protein
MDRRVDLAVTICVVALGIFVLVTAQTIKPASVPDPIGSKGGPIFVGLALVVGGLALVIRRLMRWRSEATIVSPDGVEDDSGVEAGYAPRAISIWAASVVYVLAMPFVGYLLATPIFVAVVLLLFSVRSWPMILGVSVGFTVPVFLLFAEFLNVRLPTGVLDGPLRSLGLV